MGAVRAPAVSGRFYPGTKGELERAVRELLRTVEPGAHPAAARAAIAPHAGYLYSGLTAAHVFARLRVPRLVVILAPNHTGVSRAPGGASLWEAGAFATPLGEVPIDTAFATALLAACPLVAVDHEAHRAEHAVEVLIPFLQTVRPDVAIVPLVLAWDAWPPSSELGEALAALVQGAPEPVLLLASSDLNHYEAAAVGELKDAQALAASSSAPSSACTAASCWRAAAASASPCAAARRRPPCSPPPARSAPRAPKWWTTGIRGGSPATRVPWWDTAAW